MITQNAIITGHKLELDYDNLVLEGEALSNAPFELPTGSIAVDAFSFSFTGTEWELATTKKAYFWHKPNAVYASTITNNIAVIPAEVLTETGVFCMAVTGEYTVGGSTVRISTNALKIKAVQGALTAENAPAPSPSLFEQAVQAALDGAIAQSGHYTKPVNGIPETDLASDVRIKLARANSAQPLLTAGAGINIDANNVISATGSGGLSNDAKQALLALLGKVAYIDNDGQDYYDALEAALYPPTNLVSIAAVFTQGGTVIYPSDSLDVLRQYLVVTAVYSDSTTETITDYTLSGTLTEGTSTITATYRDKTDTFDVVVSARQPLTGWDVVGTPSITNNILTCSDGNFIKTPEVFSPSSSNWKIVVKYRFTSGISGYADVLGGVDNSNASYRTVLIEHQDGSMRKVALYSSSDGNAWDIANGGNFLANLPEGVATYTWIWMSIEYDGAGYTLKYSLDGENYTTGATKTSSSKVLGGYPVAFGLKRNSVLPGEIDLSECKIYIGGDLWWEAVAS